VRTDINEIYDIFNIAVCGQNYVPPPKEEDDTKADAPTKKFDPTKRVVVGTRIALSTTGYEILAIRK
jgi:hypothetical protein